MKTESFKTKLGNIFRSILKYFAKFFRNLGKDFCYYFGTKPYMIGVFLVAVPSILIGFTLTTHITCSVNVYSEHEYVGLLLFIIMLITALNLFFMVNFSKHPGVWSLLVLWLAVLALCVTTFFYARVHYLCYLKMLEDPVIFDKTTGTVLEAGNYAKFDIYSGMKRQSILIISISVAISFIGVIICSIFTKSGKKVLE